MTRVTLVNPPIRLNQPPKHIPFGIGILASVLDKLHYDVSILDINAHRINETQVMQELKERRADIVGIGGLVTTYCYQRSLATRIAKELPRTFVIAGGGCATSLGKDMLRWAPGIEALITGEGEETLPEVVERIDSGDTLHGVAGTIHRDGDELIREPDRPLIKDLDAIPDPMYSLIPMDIYLGNSQIPFSPHFMGDDIRRMSVAHERGCPHRCKFCFHNGMGQQKVRFHSPEYAVRQMELLHDEYGVNRYSILDENLTCNRKRTLAFCDLLEKKGFPDFAKWGGLGRVDNVDPELLDRCAEVGMVYISYGAESASPEILKKMNKDQTPAQIQKAWDVTVASGISPTMTWILGSPGEKVTTMIATERFFKKNKFSAWPFLCTPYPGTEFFEEFKPKIIEKYGTVERFVEVLGDATAFSINMTDMPDEVLLGAQQLLTERSLEGSTIDEIILTGKRIINEKYGGNLYGHAQC